MKQRAQFIAVIIDGEEVYMLTAPLSYFSRRYGKTIKCTIGFKSDGATGAKDITSISWWIHDKLCDTGRFADGTRCNNWQASRILRDILKSEGRWARAIYWTVMTWSFGGGEARENGMW